MEATSTRRAVILILCSLLSMAIFVSSCAAPQSAKYRVAVIGFAGGQSDEQRNSLAEYGQKRIEAELGAEVDFLLPGSGYKVEDIFSSDNGYDLVVSLGQGSSQEMLQARPGDTQVQAAALDYSPSQPPPGSDAVSLVRYRVEEGAYVCGYLAGWLTGRNDHPLTNAAPIVGFIGAVDDPQEPYYDRGYGKGAKAVSPNVENQRYFLANAADSKNARAYAEQAIKKGADIIFCTPGAFNSEVVKVAQEKNVLVILVGTDRSGESPEHVLTSLIMRDDNALFDAVSMAMHGDLKPGPQAWGITGGIWSLAPFYSHDTYIRKELKEALRREEEKVYTIDFSS
jgi:basic membrane protein A and related proteins